ncbi:AI-2E family transporter [Roseicella aerolata]|uniref:AI-2E family transporter n=1 Tax=Roseicella aerolata TaxID=2883479 RepID=A0A9X1LAE3_9PROT|nr:AI-2E family transporter [Roseicella aerolata]MCB4821317.1 AI-2E family transporter [Roseicella aerolata]
MSRAATSLLVLFGLPLGLLLVAPRAVLLAFAGILLGVALRGGAEALARPFGLPGWAGLPVVILGLLGLLGLGAWFAAPTLAVQADDLVQQLPPAWTRLRDIAEGTGWGRALLSEFEAGDLVSQVGPGAAGVATAAVAGTAARMTDGIFLVFLGIFLAATPAWYLAGLRRLVAPALRPGFDPVMRALGRALGAWVGAQLLAMAIVGGLTFLGLTLIGMPLAGILAVLAALLGFIPILGPIIAWVPAVLLAAGEGWTVVLWVSGLYLLIQVVEGDLVTPLVQSRAIRLPPGLILAAQLVMLTLFGLLGLALAAPVAAVLLVLAQQLYVEAYLEQAPAWQAASAPDPAGSRGGGHLSAGPRQASRSGAGPDDPSRRGQLANDGR